MTGRILAVDDQRYFRELIEGMLREVGFEVETASSGEEALRILDRERFDVIVTDLVMPGMSGTELVQAVKARDPSQQVVLVTGVVDVRSAVEAMKGGATDYLLKPFDREALTGAIGRLLERKHLTEERDRLLEENIGYLGERALYGRAFEFFRCVNPDALCERVLEVVAEESQAQGAVLWRATPEGEGAFALGAVHGLVRVQDEPERLAATAVDPRLAAGALTAFAGDATGHGTHPALWIGLRAGERVLGVARLTDKAGGTGFDDVDRAGSERLLQLAGPAFINAERFEALERRVFQDPETRAYHPDYLKELARHEIEKANRFGRSFGLLQVSLRGTEGLRAALGASDFDRWLADVTDTMTRELRATDQAAVDAQGNLCVLLAETDGIGVTSFQARLRDVLEACEAITSLAPHLRPVPALGAVSCPADGSQIEKLFELLHERVESDATGQAWQHKFEALPLAACLGGILQEGEPDAPDGPRSIVDYALRELARRPREHNLLFLHPGPLHGPVLQQWLADRVEGPMASEVVLIADRQGAPGVGDDCLWVPPNRLLECPPFLVHFGEGPAFVLVTAEKPEGGELLTFQSVDRRLVEYLAFRLQRELGVPRSP